MEMKESLAARYTARLLGGFATMPINLAIQAIGNRHLGPEGLGVFSYTVGIFTEFCTFVDSGLGMAHYRKLCAEPENLAWLRFFSRVVLGLILVLALAVALAEWLGWGRSFWADIPLRWVCLGAGVALATWLVSLVGKSADAFGLTRRTEMSRVAVRLVLAGLFVLVAWLGLLGLGAYFCLQIAALVALVVIWSWQIRRAGRIAWDLRGQSAECAARERSALVTFAAPLLAYSAASLVGGVFDRWMLLSAAGETQQGFFAVGQQLGALAFVFTSALTQLLIGEYTRALAAGDHSRLRVLFADSIGALYSVSACIGVFMAANAGALLYLYAGERFRGAEHVVAIQCLLPLHQTYGQLSGSLMLAGGDSGKYSKIGIATILLGIPTTYLLVSATSVGLGALGLAVKVAVIQLLLVNLQLWHNTRLLGVSFVRFLRQQIGVPVLFGGCAFAAQWTARQAEWGPLPALLANGIIYGILAVAVAWMVNLAQVRVHLRTTLHRILPQQSR